MVSGASKKPNILLIVTDDQSPLTLSCYGNTVCSTPNLDKLAASGIVLDQAYHMGSMRGAVCSPSRTMIMSGRTLWHLPPRGKKHRKIEEGITDGKNILNNTMPAVFNRSGYDTFRTCKKGNSYDLANNLFTTVMDKTSRGASEENGSQWHGQKVIEFLKSRKTKKTKKPGQKSNDKHELKPIDEGGLSYWSKITHRWVKGHYSKSKAQFLPPEKGL